MAKIKKRKAIGMAVLDGVLWFESGEEMCRVIRKFDGIALSALLLKDFIKEKIKK